MKHLTSSVRWSMSLRVGGSGVILSVRMVICQQGRSRCNYRKLQVRGGQLVANKSNHWPFKSTCLTCFVFERHLLLSGGLTGLPLDPLCHYSRSPTSGPRMKISTDSCRGWTFIPDGTKTESWGEPGGGGWGGGVLSCTNPMKTKTTCCRL